MSRLNRILADFPLLKKAVESPDRIQHEKDFSQLAFAFLQDRAAGLLPYLLGFEVVDRDEDGSKAVGIFGFNISGHYYYVPAFFINAQIKGMDLLFSKTTNNFMPLQEEWIDKIINKSDVRLGRPANADKVQEDFESPDLTNMIEPPMMGGKTASAELDADGIAESSYAVWNDMQKTAAKMLSSDKAFQEAFAGAIAAMSGKTLEKSAEESPIIPFISNLGGPKTMESFMLSMQNIKYANAFFEFYKDLKPFHVTKYAEELKPVEVKPDLYVSENVQDINADIKDPDAQSREKARLITDGFAVVDKRKDSDKSVVYKQDISGVISSPEEAGVYDVWTDSGEFKKTIAISLYREYEPDSYLFVDPSSKDSYIAPSSAALSSKKYDESIEDALSSLSILNAPADGGKYIDGNYDNNKYCVCAKDGSYALVVNLDRRMSGKSGHLFSLYNVQGLKPTKQESDRPTFTPSESMAGFGDSSSYICPDCLQYPRYLRISSLPEKRPVVRGDTLFIPSDFKAIKLSKNEHKFLGSSATLSEGLFNDGFIRMSVDFDDTDYSVKVDGKIYDRLSKKAACLMLAKDFGLALPDVDELMSRAFTKSACTVLVKKAQLVGVNMPMIVPPGPGSDPYTGMGLPMEQPFEANQTGSLTGVPTLQDPSQPGFAVGGQSEMEVGQGGGGGGLPEDVAQLADQAAQSGQKHVFDHSTIAGLAGIYDLGYAIDMYLPELTKSLDRIGRILFLFYWKNDEFAERYGEQDLAGVEDLLRNVFKSFGSLVLRLQEKSVSGLRNVE